MLIGSVLQRQGREFDPRSDHYITIFAIFTIRMLFAYIASLRKKERSIKILVKFARYFLDAWEVGEKFQVVLPIYLSLRIARYQVYLDTTSMHTDWGEERFW